MLAIVQVYHRAYAACGNRLIVMVACGFGDCPVYRLAGAFELVKPLAPRLDRHPDLLFLVFHAREPFLRLFSAEPIMLCAVASARVIAPISRRSLLLYCSTISAITLFSSLSFNILSFCSFKHFS
jgi:hypothetical protein